MNKDFQKVIFFFFWWNILRAFQEYPFFSLLNRFDFVFVLVSAYYLIRLTVISYFEKRSTLPIFYRFVMGLLLIWIFINIFRNPPDNFKGFMRFLGGELYVAAWYPLLLFYFGSKIKVWSQIWHYALKFNKFFVLFSPIIIFLFLKQAISGWYLIMFVFFFPIFIINWDLLKRQERFYLVISIVAALVITVFGGSRALTLRILYYLPVLFFLFLLKKKNRSFLRIIIMSIVLIGVYFIGYYVYNGGLNDLGTKSNGNVIKFTSQGFENSRKMYVYPDFFMDMKDTKDWVMGRGLNGTYYSKIFETSRDKDLNEKNSLGVKKGYRTGLECGYLQIILKIGLIGLILKIILALSAIYLGLFRSNNWFVRGCAIIIIEWLISMYPSAVPEWNVSYMLFWLCIGACLSRETRNAGSSLLFLSNLNRINNNNKSFFMINRF